jgi:hypothetical protein
MEAVSDILHRLALLPQLFDAGPPTLVVGQLLVAVHRPGQPVLAHEAVTPGGGAGTLGLVVIDDDDALSRPAEQDGTLAHGVLTLG